MKLGRLITYKHMADGLSCKHVFDDIDKQLQMISNNLAVENIDFDNLKEDISKHSKEIMGNLHAIDQKLDQFKTLLTEFIDSVEAPYYQKSIEIYKDGLKDTPDYILDRYNFKRLLYEDSTKEFFINRVKLHSTWKHAAMELRPAMGDITTHLVASDPLYLVDTNPGLFAEIKKNWNPGYQQRLRYYSVDEEKDNPLEALPKLQLGLIVAVDFFNFRPMYLIERYIKGMYEVLKPGGIAMFTYNNCDFPIGIDNFENGYYTYTPGHQIKELCESNGLKVKSSFDFDNNVSWLEVQRPGRLTSLRGGQTLGMIKTL